MAVYTGLHTRSQVLPHEPGSFPEILAFRFFMHVYVGDEKKHRARQLVILAEETKGNGQNMQKPLSENSFPRNLDLI